MEIFSYIIHLLCHISTFVQLNGITVPLLFNLRKIEYVQKRALKIILKDYNGSYSKLRQQANRSLLYVDRLSQIIIEFKIYLRSIVNNVHSILMT